MSLIIIDLVGMLKGLKKGDKKQTKKQTNKQKPVKNEAKKPKEDEEEQATTDLVDINYNQKETTVKTVKKQLGSKLDEKQIDTSNIVIEKKEEKKVITSWVVDESKVKDLLRKDFKLEEHQTDFVSLTDNSINKQLEEKAKKEAEENKPKVQEVGGFKVAPLQNMEKGREQDFVFSKKTEAPSIMTSLPVKEVVFVNTNSNGALNFAPIEKTAQQLKEEELEAKLAARKQPELAIKGSKGGWLGQKANEEKQVQAEFKVSAWALKAQEGQNQPVGKFAPLQKTTQELKLEGASNRKEQDFKYSSKKEQEERRKAKEAQEAALKK